MQFNHTSVYNLDNAIRGARNPMNSWDRIDSYEQKTLEQDGSVGSVYVIGKNDMKLLQKLLGAGGNEHSKFMRQILVSVDIEAPLYWWKEFDTYKVGTTANSTSTMHKISSTPITAECFETGNDDVPAVVLSFIEWLETTRKIHIETKDKATWKELIRWLPSSWLQTRTITMNYEVLRAICKQRRNHKLTEWSEDFCGWVESLPYANELIMFNIK